jgi:RimJ/RimL family protein N-acetyltransferase
MKEGDVNFLVALFADPEVHRFVDDGEPLTVDQAELWVKRSNENHKRFGYGTGVVVEKSSGCLIGWAGFARPEGQSEEIVYGFAANSWGQGYGTEVLKGLITFAQHTLKARSTRATVHPQNRISVRLLSQQGFRREERLHNGDVNADLYVRSFD